MKKLFTLLALVITLITTAQAPQGFNYQATVRNSSGNLIVNQNVLFKFNIMLNSQTSLPVYSETHQVPTDDLGQVNLVIGTGTPTTGTFAGINWANGTYYLGIELNTGSSYVAMGTTQLLSVPYALYANSAGNSQSATPNLETVLAVNNSANNQQIKNLADPTDSNDAVNKSFLMSQVQNLQNQINILINQNNTIPSLITTSVYDITTNSSISGGNVIAENGSQVTVRGICWNTSNNPTIDLPTKTVDGFGQGTFTSNLSGLIANTTYYVRAYATNSSGTAYGNEVVFTTLSAPNYQSMYAMGTIFCDNNVTAVIDVINPITGKTWMDRNLGAFQASNDLGDSDSFGDIYQWGRGADGHQCRNSPTSLVLSSADQPGNGNFILTPNLNDWRSSQNNNLWQGLNGINNPCPNGYRLPTEAEFNEERLSWPINNNGGGFGSTLKLPSAGLRDKNNGNSFFQAGLGFYWTSSVNGIYSRVLNLTSTNAFFGDDSRSSGNSVRCIKN